MRCLNRNMQPFWYCLYEGAEDQYDEYGNLISEQAINYAEAVQMMANISAATGQAQTEQFGDLADYDKVIVTHDLSCPIDEHTVLFIDKAPEYDEEALETSGEDNESEPKVIKRPKYDYIVKRVAKSLNSISIAVRKVKVGG